MDNESKKRLEGFLTAFVCIFLYQWLVGGTSLWHTSFSQTVSRTFDEVKSPVTGKIGYRVKDILNRDTISCDVLAELNAEVDYIDDINCKSENGTTLLIALARAERHFILFHKNNLFECKKDTRSSYFKKLMARDINLNARDKWGRTALMWNSIMGFRAMEGWELEKELIKYEAALNYKDVYGLTALDYAKKYNQMFVPLLEAAIKGKAN